MQTSYFAKCAKVPNPISISRFSPLWFMGPAYPKLSPSVDLLRSYKAGTVTAQEYTKQFNAYLDTLNAKEVYSELCSLYRSENFTLLCYEKPGDFCHRHLARQWLNSNLNIQSKEYSFAPKGLFPV